MYELNHKLKLEADNLLIEFELLNILGEYAVEDNIYISGSYMLNLMAWRDLDIFIDIEDITKEKVFELVGKVMTTYEPIWLEIKETFFDNTGCPKGYFLGFESKVINGELWNVDIWITSKDYIENHNRYMNEILHKLDSKSKWTIIKLKTELIKSNKYGKEISSIDVYDAVLNKGYETKEELFNFKKVMK